jgi:hypothetical protein
MRAATMRRVAANPSVSGDGATGENNVFLIGRPPIQEFLDFVQAQAADRHSVDVGALATEWRSANDHVRQLEADERGLADGPEISPVPAELQELAAVVAGDPAIKRAFETLPWRLGLVELDRLVVYQKRIGLEQVARMRARLGPDPSPEAVFSLCLPVGPGTPPSVNIVRGSNGWLFVSPSNDLRILDARVLVPTQVTGYQVGGIPLAS